MLVNMILTLNDFEKISRFFSSFQLIILLQTKKLFDNTEDDKPSETLLLGDSYRKINKSGKQNVKYVNKEVLPLILKAI